MVLKTLEAIGPLHGYRIARRIEQISGDQLALNQGSLYPALLKLEQQGLDRVEVGRVGKRPPREDLRADARGAQAAPRRSAQWQRATDIVGRFFTISEDLP